MSDPRFAQHLPPESPVPRLAVPAVSPIRRARFQIERVRGSAQRNNRPARFHVIGAVLHLSVRQLAESREQVQQLGRIQSFQSRYVGRLVRIDPAILPVDRELPAAITALTL